MFKPQLVNEEHQCNDDRHNESDGRGDDGHYDGEEEQGGDTYLVANELVYILT